MTDETFERAKAIQTEIDSLNVLLDVLHNSEYHYLAAVGGTKNGFTFEIERCFNHTKLSTKMLDKFTTIIWEEIDKLNNEFKNL